MTSLHDTARRDRDHHHRIHDLPLAAVATLIIADLTRDGITPKPALPARIGYAAEVFRAHRLIRVLVYGLTDRELNASGDVLSDGPCPDDYAGIVTAVADRYRRSHGDPFRFEVVLLNERAQQARPDIGSVTVTRATPATRSRYA